MPIGTFALFVLLIILPANPPPKTHVGESLRQRIKQFDPLGTAFLVPGLVFLLITLQWGGNEYAGGSTRVKVCLVFGVMLLIAFALCQLRVGNNGKWPTHTTVHVQIRQLY